MLVFSAITAPILVGAAGAVGSELGLVPHINSLEERIWVLKNFPEAVKDQEICQKATNAINSYNEVMKFADIEEDAWIDFNSDGPSILHYELKEKCSEKAAKMRRKAETKLKEIKKELNTYIQNKYYI